MTTRVLTRTAAFVMILLVLLLSSCELPNRGAQTPTPEATAVSGEEAAAEASPEAEAEAEAEESPAASRSSALNAAGLRELSAADFAPESEGMHGLILFTSSAKQPFADILLAEPALPYAERQLWAVSPDGYGTDLLTSPQPGGVPRLLQYGFTANNDTLQTVAAPDGCLAADPPCGNFRLSPDGRFLAYFYGEYTDCGRTLQLVAMGSGTVVREIPGAQWAYFAADSTLMLASGACDSAQAAVYIPHNGKYAGTAQGGDFYWNPSRTAALIQSHQPAGAAHAALWGFNLMTGKVFMWMNDPEVLEDLPTWTPEGNAYLFNHRKVHFDKSSSTMLLEGPRQILWMNADNRSQRRLAYDARYDYHLCAEDGKPCDEWYGDWIKVLRTPFQPIAFQIDPDTGKAEDRPAVRCTLTGSDCAEPAEVFALNWKTGEMLPWDEAGLGEPTPALVNAPNMSVDPIYADPDGAYTFYPGLDGHSLWYVPAESDPELWVRDGEGFIYLP